MIKIFKTLQKSNGLTIQHKTLKSQTNEIVKAFKPFNIDCKVKTELDYFEALIQYQALLNKQKFEKLYEDQRHELFEIWDNMSYQERNRLIQIKLDEVKETCKYFKTSEDKVIWIPFFDTLLNGLYHNDIAIFELQQYFKLYKDFKDRRVSIREYGFLPYSSQFIDVQVILERKDRIYFYYHPLASIFELNSTFELTRIPLDCDACKITPFTKDLLQIINAYRSENVKTFLEACIESSLISEKSKKVLQKRLSKEK